MNYNFALLKAQKDEINFWLTMKKSPCNAAPGEASAHPKFNVVLARPFQRWKLNHKETIKESQTTVTFSYAFYLLLLGFQFWCNGKILFLTCILHNYFLKIFLLRNCPVSHNFYPDHPLFCNPSKFPSLWLVDRPSSIRERMKWNFPLKPIWRGATINHFAATSFATTPKKIKYSTKDTASLGGQICF